MSSTTDPLQTGQTVECVHCGLPAPKPDNDSAPAFCCNGCKGAWELIHGWGLEDYYALRDCGPSETLEDRGRDSFDDLDDPKLLFPSVVKQGIGPNGIELARVRLSIRGLHCAACAWLIEQAPNHVAGWHSASVQMHSRSVELVYDPSVVKLSQLGRLLKTIGYRVVPLDESDERNASNQESRRLLVDVAIAGFCAMNAMWIAVALYAGAFSGIEESQRNLLRFTGVGLGVAAVIFPGRVFLRGAVASIRLRVPHMDLPVALGLSAGVIASIYGLFETSSEVYFDSIATLVFFLLVGRWVQLRQQHSAGRAISALLNLTPNAATRVDEDERLTRVPASEIRPGDIVRVEPGESIPVDGRVVRGQSHLDRSLLTGESRPVAIGVGSDVEAGTENIESVIHVETTAMGEATRLGALSQSVAEAAASKTPIVQLANRVGGWFVSVVMVLAVVTVAAWWHVDPSLAINHSVALLIVACPCALALATPLAIAVAVGRLAERRILVRSGESLEQFSKPGTIFFDKTGTLTQGRMQVTHWFGEAEILQRVQAIESTIGHPIARAIAAYQRNSDVDSITATDVQNRVGVGVEGVVQGRRFTIGSLKLVDQLDLAVCPLEQEQIETILASGSTPILVVVDERIEALFGVSDPLRSEAKQVIAQLRDSGWKVAMLSGDHGSIVREVANRLGIDAKLALGDQSPEQKLAAIQRAKQDGHVVAMVGDGVNDAAALAAADVGVALRGGANASLAAAPILIGNSRLEGIVTLTKTAKRTARSIRQNFAVSIGYNGIAAVLAMTGIISPLIAAILMPISSLTVLTMTLATPVVDAAAADANQSKSSPRTSPPPTMEPVI
ncbi:heavy metal translocating P-type ATPase [Novipirellula caenicola]|uniref:Copper-importing P-type ATPase A n=1 Tax=Novipirellula caenicola TaxID=1536901 RepID=A0ABP9W144_9BACT